MAIASYCITDPSIIGSTIESVREGISKIIHNHTPEYICLRDKTTHQYAELAEAFLTLKGPHKPILHGDINLAIQLGAFGVHLSSLQLDEIVKAKEAGLFVIASTHSLEEIEMAKGADAITYSPIFPSPNKGKAKGLGDLKETVGKINTKIIALGGIINQEQIKQVEACGVYGFASIRYFK